MSGRGNRRGDLRRLARDAQPVLLVGDLDLGEARLLQQARELSDAAGAR
jgi:hypothetical protein